jgi:hypothetical protein
MVTYLVAKIYAPKVFLIWLSFVLKNAKQITNILVG